MLKIDNKEKVTAVCINGNQLTYRFGQLKADFLNGTLAKQKIEVSHIYIQRTNQSVKVSYHRTKGFSYKVMS